MKRLLLVILTTIVMLPAAMADSWFNYQANYTEGKEFYVTYMHANTQAGTSDLSIALFMAARTPTTVTIKDASTNLIIKTITIPATNLSNSYAVWSSTDAGNPGWFQAQDYYCTASNTVYPRSIMVTATNDIALYMANSAASSSDASLVIPTNRLGTEYVIQTPSSNAEVAEFAIVAVEDGTTVQVTPTNSLANSGGSAIPAGSTITQTLSRGQVYFLAAASRAFQISGTKICANKDVMVFNGSQSMKTPSSVQGHVCHQTTPIQVWGKNFPVVIMAPQNNNFIRLTARDYPASVKIHTNGGVISRNITAFGSTDLTWNSLSSGSALYIESDEPIICYQYMLAKADQHMTQIDPFTSEYDAGGYPASTIITPMEQGINSAMFGTFQDNVHLLTYHVNIVCPTASISTMELDGAPIASSLFMPVPGLAGYSFVSLQVADGAHSLTNSTGEFTAIAYGLTDPTDSEDWSYAYNVGMNTQHLDAYIEIDGVKTNYAMKCEDENHQWVYDFEGVVEYNYDSIEWFCEGTKFATGDSIHHIFNQEDFLLKNIMMVVHYTTPICLIDVVDTVKAQVYNALTYHIINPVEYHCRRDHDTINIFPGTEFEQVIAADTVPAYVTRSIMGNFKTVMGCDSTIQFKYMVSDPQDTIETHRICQGSSFVYKGQVMTAEGEYVFDEYDTVGCLYYKTMKIIVDPTYDIHEYDTICDVFLPYLWWHDETDVDTFWNTTPDAVRHYTTIHGCDSARHLHLVVGQSYLIETSEEVCDNELPYTWRGRSLTETGVYYDSLQTIHRCDSVYKLNLIVNPTYYTADTAAICDNESYTWHGQTYTQAGTYWDNHTTTRGCDSIFSLKLSINPTYLAQQSQAVCQNGSLTWRGKTIAAPVAGVHHYYDSVPTLTGCDSVYELILTVHPTYTVEVRREICQGGTYEFAGDPAHTWMNTVVGQHRDTAVLRSKFGCDSAVILLLTVNKVYNYDTVGITCTNVPFHWVQADMDTIISQTTPGTQDYYSRHKSIHGCDSTYHLSLTSNNVLVKQRTVSISDRDSVMWDGMVYAGPKYSATVPDSVIRTLDTPITINHMYQSLTSGCDSLMQLIITVFQTYEIEENATTCQYEPYPIEGHSSWTWRKDIVGNHDTLYTYKTVHNYDSVRHLFLTVHPVYHSSDTANTCTNTDYNWDGHKHIGYNTPGVYIYYDSLTTVHGCDSIFQLVLNVYDTVAHTTLHTMCDVDTFTWDNVLFAGNKSPFKFLAEVTLSPGTHNYSNHYGTENDCDSIEYLSLTIYPSYEIYDTAETCQGNPYIISEDDPTYWTLHKDTAGVYDDTFTYPTIHGCDSVRHLHLTVHPEYSIAETKYTCCNNEYVWPGHERIIIGKQPVGYHFYQDSLTTKEYGCDSVHILHLYVQDTIIVPTTRVICDVDTVTWDSTLFAGHKSPLVSMADIVLTPNTYNYRRTYTSATNCDSFMTLTLTVNPSYEFFDTTSTCQGNAYIANPDDPTLWTLHKDTAGVYDDTFRHQTINGCDSVRHMHLTVHPEYSIEETIYTCCNNEFVWPGHDTVVIGKRPVGYYVYRDSLFTKEYGCDSVHILHLYVQDTIIVPTTRVICDVDTVTWDSTLFAGHKSPLVSMADIVLTPNTYNYRRTYTSATNCDSFMTLTLTVNPTYEFYDTAETCQRNAYIANPDDPTYWTLHKDTAGVYDDTFNYQTIHGCDSVRHLHLTVHPEYSIEETKYTCCNNEYVWPGHERIVIGKQPVGYHFYQDSLTTKEYGCDSVHILHLYVQDTIIVPTTRVICDVDTVTWDSTLFAGHKSPLVSMADIVLTPNTYNYRRTYTSATNCDSFMTLTLTVNPTYEFYDTVSTCQGNAYIANPDDPTLWTLHKDTAGVYDDTFRHQTINGCDSVRHMHLTVHPEYSIEETIYTCCNNEFVWPGHDTVVIGRRPVGYYVYRDSLFTKDYGCDSVHILHLYVQDTIIVPTTRVICDIDTVTWDSTLFAGHKSPLVSMADVVLTPGVYNYRRTYESATKCDSFMTFRLTVNPTYEFYDTVSTCQGNAYIANPDDPTLWTLHKDTAGVYDDTFRHQTINGCDSVRHMHLTVHPEYSIEETIYTCCNNEFVWPGHDTVVIGKRPVGYYVYRDSLFTKDYGCDSVHILHLYVQDTIIVPTTRVICDVDTVTWDSTLFAGHKSPLVSMADIVLTPGVYNYRRTYESATKCDSFMTFRLTVNPTYEFYDTAETCQRNAYIANPDDPTYWTLHKDTAGVYDDTFRYQTIHGCDSVRHLHLTVHPEYTYEETVRTCCNSDYVWPGHERIIIGQKPVGTYLYHDSLFTDVYGCDSVHILHLIVQDTIINPTVHVMCDNDTLRWDHTLITGNRSQHTSLADTILSAGIYDFRRTYTSATGCDSFVTLRVTIHPTYERYDTALVTCQYDDYLFQGQTWSWKKNIAGVHDTTYIYQTVNHCDSIWHLRVKVNPEYFISERASTCSNEPYVWEGHGRTYSGLTPGLHTYYDSLLTYEGCDSVHELKLFVVDTIVMFTHRTMCDNDTVMWQNSLFRGVNWPGIGGTVLRDSAYPYVFDRLYKSEVTGCDSIERLFLTVHRTDLTILDSTSICQYETLRFGTHDIPCNRRGTFTFTDSLRNIYGCDSIVKITVRVDSVYNYVTNMTICDNTTWTWREHTYSNLPAGTYSELDHYQTIHGCDSDYVLNLTVVHSYLFVDTFRMCDYDVTVWRGKSFGPLPAGVYIYDDSLHTVGCGCDSIYRFKLNVHASYFIHDTLSMCDNETIQVRQHTIYGPAGKYQFIDTLPSMYNCDSVIELTVYINPTFFFPEYMSICSNETYTWHGKTYKVAGTYYDSLLTQYGCDSVYELTLHVKPTFLFESTRTICDNESVQFQGMTLRDAGDYTFGYQSIEGCDSVYLLHLIVNPTYHNTLNVSICDNQTYQFAGQTLRQSGVYYDSTHTTKGCDSITVLNLTVYPTYHYITHQEICNGDTLAWHGMEFLKTGTYYDSLLTRYGCDSIHELQLTVHPTYFPVIDTAVCDYQTFRWSGKKYGPYQAGDYTLTDARQTIHGCDSITTINLRVIETLPDTLYDTICAGEVYDFGTQKLTKTGIYHDTICQPMVDDCRYRTLFLLVNDPTLFVSSSIRDICADDPEFFIDYKWMGGQPVRYSVMFDDDGHRQGFEDIIDADYADSIAVTVPSLYVDGYQPHYVRPDHYKVRVQLDNGGCDPKANEVELDLLVRYPSMIIEQNWDDVVSLLNRHFNGNYEFSEYYWVVNGVSHTEETGSYLYWPGRLQVGDKVYIMLKRENESYYLPSCEIVVGMVDQNAANGQPLFEAAPDPHGALQISPYVDGQYIISDAAGRRLAEGSGREGVIETVDMDYPAGVYFIYYYTSDGRFSVRKVLIH